MWHPGTERTTTQARLNLTSSVFLPLIAILQIPCLSPWAAASLPTPQGDSDSFESTGRSHTQPSLAPPPPPQGDSYSFESMGRSHTQTSLAPPPLLRVILTRSILTSGH